jgi:uncharacterized protein (UPF0332 family)
MEAEMARSRKALSAAETLLNAGLYEDCVSRAYYAVLHAARASLAVANAFPSTHSGLRRMFALHLVKPEIIEREYGEILAIEQEDRETCDYTAAVTMEPAKARDRVAAARRFAGRIDSYLASLESHNGTR